MRHVTLCTAFWTEDTNGWTADARLLYLWTWTNDHAHGLTGIYACGEASILAETGLSKRRLEKAKEIIRDKVRWYPDSWLWVVGRAKHTMTGSPEKYLMGLESHINTIPEGIRRDFWSKYELVAKGDGKKAFRQKVLERTDLAIPLPSPPNGILPDDTESVIRNPNPISESDKDSSSKPNSFDVSFDAFWQAYPRKTAKGAAKKAWKKLKDIDALLPVILKAVEVQIAARHLDITRKTFIPHPSTWLHGECWLDEIVPHGDEQGREQKTDWAKVFGHKVEGIP